MHRYIIRKFEQIRANKLSDAILKELCNGIFTIALNRPEKLNCINIEMLDMLQDCIAEAEENDEIRIVVIEGRGGARLFNRRRLESVRGLGCSGYSGMDTQGARHF